MSMMSRDRQPRRGAALAVRAVGQVLGLGLVIGLLLAGEGCGYQLRPPYDGTIQTVYVPIFRSVTFRRDLNLQLTERVMKEIEQRTPFKVVGTPEQADYTLEGEILLADKNAILQNPNNLPRQIAASLTASLAFVPTRGQTVGRARERVQISETVNFYPELGETTASAYDKAIEQMARQIVGSLEESW